jgi:phenylpyruvate tautomerase PptA (4-oxalocrotonate tautomerase family)
MTIVRVDLIGTSLDKEAKAELARRVISAFCEIEVGRDIAAAHGGFVVHVAEASEDGVFMGDAPMVEASAAGKAAVVTMQVMAGPWTDEMKSDIFRRLEMVVRESTAMPRQGLGADIWMTITEIPEGGWSVGGRTVGIAKLAPAFDEDRQQRIREYLESR